MAKTYKILLSFFLILMSGMGFSQSVPSYVPTSGLVGWWGFNGNAQDGSGNGNHGTVNGATLTTDRFGNQSAAYSFNGINSLIELPVNLQGVLTNLNQFSLSAYIRKNNTLSGGDIYGGGIFSNWKAFPLSDPFGMLVKSDVGFGSGNCSGTGVTSRDTLFSDLWYHISVVFNGYQNDALSRMKLYINGNLQFTDSGSTVYSPISVSNSLGNQSTHTAFGAWMSQFGWVGYFNGKIDDIGIWNRALTPQEITNLYNSQLPTQTSLCLPTITTTSPSSVGVDTVVIGGDIPNDGGSSIVLRGVCYSTSPNPNMGDQRTEDGSGIGSFNTVLRGLTPSTTYYARSYAKNSNGVVVYGNEVSFSTSSITIGSNYAGGIVFYLDGTGQHGLVCAPNDQGTLIWGCWGAIIPNTQLGVGTGFANTQLIVNGCSQRPIAASVCNDLVLNGYDDWYLPSRGELMLMYNNLRYYGLGNFSPFYYWTSSQSYGNPINTWTIAFNSGNSQTWYEGYTNVVRAIRSF